LKLPLLLVQNTLFCRPILYRCSGATGWINHLHNLRSKVSEPIFRQSSQRFISVNCTCNNCIVCFFLSNGMGSPEIIDSSIVVSPSVIFRQQEFFTWLCEANHPFDIMNRNNFIASFND
jgi:hypothetical protein